MKGGHRFTEDTYSLRHIRLVWIWIHGLRLTKKKGLKGNEIFFFCKSFIATHDDHFIKARRIMNVYNCGFSLFNSYAFCATAALRRRRRWEEVVWWWVICWGRRRRESVAPSSNGHPGSQSAAAAAPQRRGTQIRWRPRPWPWRWRILRWPPNPNMTAAAPAAKVFCKTQNLLFYRWL